ncbi:MAG: TIGR00282 family metallophosphoesterase [Rickettsiales bacterium]|jgi:metallophosphoesterase (TIGR00282 family)
MKILFLGDVVGRSGRDAIVKYLPILRREMALDAVIVNGDNAAGGFGITPQIAKDFFVCGADVITGGDHIWDQQKDIVPYLAQEKRLLRPENFPVKTVGSGNFLLTLADGRRLLVLHLLGQVFHKEHTRCPFLTADEILEKYRLAPNMAILVDFHAEATSEKTAMGKYLDGRVSVVVGTHTHIPTADARILPKGTAYQTDTGMCGDYDSVIGFNANAPLERFLNKISKPKLEAAMGVATLCGLYVEIDDKTGLANNCQIIMHPKALNN